MIYLPRLYPVGESNSTEGIRDALKKRKCLMDVAEGTHPLNSREIKGTTLKIISSCPESLLLNKSVLTSLEMLAS